MQTLNVKIAFRRINTAIYFTGLHYSFVSCFRLESKLELLGPLAPNAVLDKAEALLNGEITGPESIATRKDEVYTGLIGGHIIRYKNGEVSKVA